MSHRVLVAALLFLTLGARAEEKSDAVLVRAWPLSKTTSLAEIGHNVGIVFSPDLSVAGNCRFYEALGFACFEETDWSRVLDGIRTHNILYPERTIRTVILETHGTNGNGLKLQRSYDPQAERSYIAVGALQEQLETDGVSTIIISACNSGRLMRPSIYKQIDRWNGDKLFLPATCGIFDASTHWSPTRSSVTVLTPRSSHIETTVAGSIRELSPAARRLITASAKARHLQPPSSFAASDILCQIVTRDPHLELAAGDYVDELSRETQADQVSDELFTRFITLLNARAALESVPGTQTASRKRARTRAAVR